MKQVISDTKVPIKIWTDEVEEESMRQLRNMSNMPFIYKHIAVMPDVHAGKGSSVGTVIPTQGAICPSTVGVDIGCGMCAAKLPFNVDALGGDEQLRNLRHSIERSIPTGHHGNKIVTPSASQFFKSLGEVSQYAKDHMRNHHNVMQKAIASIGTLGGGNHFIEICKDQDNNAWIMLHSGSRNVGKSLAEIHIDRAKGLMKQYFIDLPDMDLAFLAQGTEEFKNYLHDLMWAQQFAMFNRQEMMNRVMEQVYRHVYKNEWQEKINTRVEFVVNCHHNYTSIENHFGKNVYVTRKGAVSAREGEYGIIPGSMGTRSYIVKGLGNSESFCSCSHGAGRKMSRTKARELFTLEDLKQQTAGIECRKDDAVIDEIPGSYKDIDVVMENQKDLVTPLYELKQLICIKGD
jgi:tRNA-splicing ligase RtcB